MVGALAVIVGAAALIVGCKQNSDDKSSKTEIPSEYVASYTGTFTGGGIRYMGNDCRQVRSNFRKI